MSSHGIEKQPDKNRPVDILEVYDRKPRHADAVKLSFVTLSLLGYIGCAQMRLDCD